MTYIRKIHHILPGANLPALAQNSFSPNSSNIYSKHRSKYQSFIEAEKNSIPQKNPSGDKINNS